MIVPTGDTIRTADIIEKLHERYPAPKWAAFTELRDAAGFGACRSCDFWAINTWPSGAFMRVAVEVKVSRGDFLRELNDPGKRAHFLAISHEFYFATPSKLLEPREIPEGVGLLEATAKTLRTKVRAKQREPEDLDISQVATLLRAAVDKTQRIERQNRSFAEFSGRAVGINDLRRLANKLFVRESDVLRCQVRDELREERRKHAKAGLWIDGWFRTIECINRVMKDALGLPWDSKPTPRDAQTWLESLPHKKFGRLARLAREFAEEVQGSASGKARNDG